MREERRRQSRVRFIPRSRLGQIHRSFEYVLDYAIGEVVGWRITFTTRMSREIPAKDFGRKNRRARKIVHTCALPFAGWSATLRWYLWKIVSPDHYIQESLLHQQRLGRDRQNLIVGLSLSFCFQSFRWIFHKSRRTTGLASRSLFSLLSSPSTLFVSL